MQTITCEIRIVGTLDRGSHELSHGERAFLKRFAYPRVRTIVRPPTFLEAVGLCEEDMDILLLSRTDLSFATLFIPLISSEERRFNIIRVDDLPYGIICFREAITFSGKSLVWSNPIQVFLKERNRDTGF